MRSRYILFGFIDDILITDTRPQVGIPSWLLFYLFIEWNGRWDACDPGRAIPSETARVGAMTDDNETNRRYRRESTLSGTRFEIRTSAVMQAVQLVASIARRPVRGGRARRTRTGRHFGSANVAGATSSMTLNSTPSTST
jgi:hypothetical protein